MHQPIQCVYLTCFAAEFSTLAAVLRYSGIHARRADTLDEADFYLTVTAATALLSDVRFLDGDWRDTLAMARARHPLTPALLAAEEADWPYLQDAYRLGACGVLWKPLDFRLAVAQIRKLNQAARDRARWSAERLARSPDAIAHRRSSA